MKREHVRYYFAGLVALITLGVYLTALQNKFVEWDDSLYISRNSYIRLINLAFFKWAFSSFYAMNWHPLTWISHALDYAIWGLNPLGHHLTSILLHAVNTFIVVLLTMKLIRIAGEGASGNETVSALDERGTLIAGGVTGFLFGLHPLHVESVAWVAERKDLLCALFFLLSISAYSRYVRAPDSESRQGTSAVRFFSKGYLLPLLFFALALLSKPMAVSLPVVLLILDWFPFRRIRDLKTFLSAFQEKIPFIALGLVSSVLTVLAQRVAIGQMEFVPFSTRILVAARSLMAYLSKMIWPNLSPYYPYPNGVSLFSPEYLAPIFLVAGITVASFVAAGKNKLWLSAWGYYVITLLPVLGIVQVGGQAMADRYTYLPCLGPFFVVGLISARGFVMVGTPERRGLVQKVFAAAALVVVVALSYLTVKQIAVWNDSIDLWSYVIKKDRTVYNAYNNRGLAFSRMGQIDKAIEDYDMAIALNSNFPNAHGNLGIAFLQKDWFDRAIEEFQTAARLSPQLAEAHIDLGAAYARKGLKEKSFEEYETAVKVNPAFADAHYWLGSALEDKGLLDEAIGQWQIALRLKPNYPEAHEKLAAALRKQGRTREALEHYLIVAKLRPNDALSHLNLGAAYGDLGSFDKAIEHLEIAIRINPGLTDAHYNLGAAYEMKGLMDPAIEQYEAAARLNPGDESIRRDLDRATAMKTRKGQ